MDQYNTQPKSIAVLKMEANKSEKPFVPMIVAGGIVLFISVVIKVVSSTLFAVNLSDIIKEAGRITSLLDLDFSNLKVTIPLILYGVSSFLFFIGGGLLGAGIPLYVVTKRRRIAATAILEKAEK